MSGDNLQNGVAVFPPGYCAMGVLLHVTSLPSRYGIGDLERVFKLGFCMRQPA